MSEAWKYTMDAILWTLLIFGVWKMITIAKHIAKRYYEKFICKIFMNNKNEK